MQKHAMPCRAQVNLWSEHEFVEEVLPVHPTPSRNVLRL